jgi:glycosyltransferase involved in cell wall biosynthesis
MSRPNRLLGASMRIGLVTHKLVRGDGQGRVNLEVAAEALRRGWQVTLVASEVCPELLSSPNVVWERITVRSLPTELLRNQLFAWRSWRRLRKIRRGLDVVCVNGFITWGSAQLNAAHYIHTAWLRSPYRRRTRGWTPRGVYQFIYTVLNSWLERGAYRRSDVVIAVSQQVKRQLIEIGVRENRIIVIPNGIDTREFRPGSADRVNLGVRTGAVTGIFVGQLKTPHKNLQTVLRALPHCPEVHLLVAGVLGGDRYPSLARDLGIAERVHFLGYQTDIAELMRAVDFVVFPSVHDSSGLVLLEGMATGLPVITARTVGGAEMVAANSIIVLEDPEDAGAMADAINRLAGSQVLRASMGYAGRAEALRLDLSMMAASYCDLFQSYAATGVA